MAEGVELTVGATRAEAMERTELIEDLDGAVPARAAGGRHQGGPAARRHGLRRLRAERQRGRRRQAEVVLHLLLRPPAPCPSWARPRCAARRRRSCSPAARTTCAARSCRCGSTRVAVPGRGRTRTACCGLYLDGRRIADVGPAADAGVLPAHARQRQVGDGGRAHHPVGLPDLPDGLPGLPVLRRQGGVPVLRHQPQLAPAQGGGPPVHRGEAGRGGAGGAGDHRPVRHREGRPPRTPSPAARSPRRSTGRDEADFYGRYAKAIEERFPGRWIGKVVAQALPKADVQRFHDYGVQIYHPNYEVWDQRLFELYCPGKERYVGRDEWHRRILDSAEVFGARNVIPNFVAGVEMAEPFGFTDGRRGDRLDHRGAAVLHVARHHPAVHHLVPGADHAARARPTRRARRWSTTSGCWRPTARRWSGYGLVLAARLRAARSRPRRLLGQLLHGQPAGRAGEWCTAGGAGDRLTAGARSADGAAPASTVD